MSKLDTLLVDGLRSELMLKQQLKAFSETLRQQLQEAERRQGKELERRIHQNALLATDKGQVGMRTSTSTSALSLNKETSHHPKQSERPHSSSPAWQYHSVRTSMLTPTMTQHCEKLPLSKTTQMSKEEEDEAECKKKFCALPVPSHVIQPLYQEMMELSEKKRMEVHEQRRDFLLSIQKPFHFQEREKEKKEKLIAMFKQVSYDQKNKAASVKKPSYKDVKHLSDSELKVCADQELCKQVTAPITVRQENPTVKLRIAERTRKEKLGFLDEGPTFRPKINHQVPDFNKLHKALQTEGLRKTQSKDGIKCQPFYLRTSALPERKNRMSPENSQEPKISNLNRCKSLGTLTSLSANTLPTFITVDVTKRCMAIRKSMEMRDSKNQESDWLRKYQMRSQSMKKAITLHAKLLDPHSSLKEVHNEKLQRHRAAVQQRTREYKRELRDMKARVSERPYLFEQVKQKNAKALAEQTYRDKLKKAGLKEQFVEENGEAAEETTSSRSADDTDGNDIHSREENVDDGKKIGDVEEKSVKSRWEEIP